MANEFIIRKGYKSLASSEVTGSLTLIGDYEAIRALTINSTKGSGTEHYFRTHGVNGDTLAIYSGGNRVLSVDSNSIDVLGSISGSTYYGDGSNLTGVLTSLNGAVLTTGDQTVAGVKTFTSDIHIENGGAKLYLKDTSDDDDHAIYFQSNADTIEYVIATQDFTGGGLGDGMFIGSVSSDPLVLATANTAALTIDTSQNATFAGDLTVSGSNTIKSSNPTLLLVQQGAANQANSGRIVFAESTSNTAGHMIIRYDGSDDKIHFDSAIDGTSDLFTFARSGDATVSGDLTVAGTVTAQEFHTEFVSASIVYESGSTKFGDTLDDNHDFTGSLNISGSLAVDGTAPTWNQDTTGTAATASYVAGANVNGTVANATTASYALTAPYSGLQGTTPTWNQNTTGTAATASYVDYSNLAGTVPTWNQDTTGTAATASYVAASNIDGSVNADTVDSKHATDFTLDYVTDNGSSTSNSITLGPSAVNGGRILAQNYNGSNVLGVISSQYSSGNLLIGYGLEGNNGGTGYLSTYGNFSGRHGAIEVFSKGFKYVGDTSNSETAVGTAVTVTEFFKVDEGNLTTSGTLTVSGASGTINGNTIWHAGNDGPTSGLAAQTAATASYVDYSNLAGTVPTWNQNTTGTAATASYVAGGNVDGTVANATTASYALTAPYSGLQGTTPTWNQDTTGTAATASYVDYSNLAGTVPTWNQDTTGTAATASYVAGGNVDGTVASATTASYASNADTLDGNHASAFATSGHSHNIWDLTYSRTGINVDSAGSNNTWDYLHGTSTTDGTFPGSYMYLVNFGDESHGIQFAHSYGSPTNGLYFRNGSDNPSAENGANTYTNWRRILTTSDEGSGNGLDADTLDGNHASAFLTSLPSHNHDDRYYTETETNEALAALRGWVPGYSNSDEGSVKWNFSQDAVELQSSTDGSTGIVYQARRVVTGETVRFTVMVKGSAASSSGLYLRIYQHDGDMPDGKTHVSNDAIYTLVQEDDRGDTAWYENGAITTGWVTFEREYTAPTSGYVSLVVLNWTGIGSNSVYIKTPDIQTVKAGDTNTLDGIDSTQFLRSDTNDTMTGTLTFNNSTNTKLSFNDSNAYWLATATNWGIYWNTSNNQLQFHGSGNTRGYIDLDTGRLGISEHLLAGGNVYSSGNEGFVFGSSTGEGEYIKRSGNDIQFFAGGSVRMTVDGDVGSVGIGTTSPSSELHVSGTGTVARLQSDSTFVDLLLSSNLNSGFLNLDNDKMNFYVGGGSSGDLKMSILNNGNVGIGTTTPSSKLEVYGSGSTILDIQGSQGQLFSVTDDLTGTLFSVSDISGIPIFEVDASGESSFDGNVGIGTTSPSEKLTVDGNISATGTITGSNLSGTNTGDQDLSGYSLTSHNHDDRYYTETESDSRFVNVTGDTMTGNLTVGSTARAANTVIRALSSDAYNAGFEAYGNSQGTGYLYVGQSSAYGGGISYNGDGAPAFAAGESSDRITFFRRTAGNTSEVFSYAHNSDAVAFNGNVGIGIGTTSPGAKLEVRVNGIGNSAGDESNSIIFQGDRHDWIFKQIRTAAATDWNSTTLRLQTRVDSTNMSSIDFVTDASYNRHIDINTNSNGFNTRFTHDGKVGIGTTNPSYKTDVINTNSNQTTLDSLTFRARSENYAGTVAVFENSFGQNTSIRISDTVDDMYVVSRNGIMGLGASGGWSSNNLNIKSNGYVGIGNRNPSARLHVKGGNIRVDSGNGIDFYDGPSLKGSINPFSSILNISSTYKIAFRTGGTQTEKMRLTDDGRLLLNTPDDASAYNSRFEAIGSSADASTNMTFKTNGRLGLGEYNPDAKIHIIGTTGDTSNLIKIKNTSNTGAVIDFRNSSNYSAGRISMPTSTTVNYGTTSDYRLKTNVVDLENGIEKVKKLKPSRFEWIENGIEVDGFIAHEVAEVVPEAVTGVKDAVDENNDPVYQDLDYSKVIPVLTAALKEAIEKIELLETRIQTLENN